MGNNSQVKSIRVRFVGELKFINGRTRKFDGEVPIKKTSILTLELGKFYKENPSVNQSLFGGMDGKFYDLETKEEIRVYAI